MAVEQTINANAKSWLKGIVTVNGWMVTASMKSKILNATLDYGEMNIPE